MQALDVQALPATFRQAPSGYLALGMAAAFGALFGGLFAYCIRTGQSYGITAFAAIGAIFFAVLLLLGIKQQKTITADEQGLRSSACWGLFKEQIAWPEVEYAEYLDSAASTSRSGPPRNYCFMRRGQPRTFGIRWRCLLFTDRLDGFDALAALVSRKSVEYGFPVKTVA